MDIQTKYNKGDDVVFYSDDYACNLKGKIYKIELEYEDQLEISYWIEVADHPTWKVNGRHCIKEGVIIGNV